MNDEFKEYRITFCGALCDIVESEEEFIERYNGRSLLRGCLTFNDFVLADDPWDYKGLTPR